MSHNNYKEHNYHNLMGTDNKQKHKTGGFEDDGPTEDYLLLYDRLDRAYTLMTVDDNPLCYQVILSAKEIIMRRDGIRLEPHHVIDFTVLSPACIRELSQFMEVQVSQLAGPDWYEMAPTYEEYLSVHFEMDCQAHHSGAYNDGVGQWSSSSSSSSTSQEAHLPGPSSSMTFTDRSLHHRDHHHDHHLHRPAKADIGDRNQVSHLVAKMSLNE